MTGKFIGVEIDGLVTVHMRHPTGNYATLCGLDGDDPGVGQRAPLIWPKQVDCHDCIAIWLTVKEYRKVDLAPVTLAEVERMRR